jgi:hypothetical protein
MKFASTTAISILFAYVEDVIRKDCPSIFICKPPLIRAESIIHDWHDS